MSELGVFLGGFDTPPQLQTSLELQSQTKPIEIWLQHTWWWNHGFYMEDKSKTCDLRKACGSAANRITSVVDLHVHELNRASVVFPLSYAPHLCSPLAKGRSRCLLSTVRCIVLLVVWQSGLNDSLETNHAIEAWMLCSGHERVRGL